MNEAYRKLGDTTSYMQMEQDPTRSIARLIKISVQEALALDYISKDLADFLVIDFPRIPTFYLLPKIHKPGFPTKDRPIVAAQRSLLENISKYVDSFLQPHVKKIKTYIQDTRDFILKVDGMQIPPNSMLVSLDVVSLYTSIPHEDIRSVVQQYLEKDLNLQPPLHFILDLIDILLDKNYFHFDGNFYYQIKGVSMGSSFSPSVANLLIATLEDDYILNAQNNPFFGDIIFFTRFIDDIFCVYANPNSLRPFVEWLNGIHSSVRFTFTGSSSSVDFLDTTVYKTPHDSLAIKPFVKATDMNSYLHFSSHHPRHLRTNIPYGKFLRVKRNSTDSEDYKSHSLRLSQQFVDRGYPSDIVKAACQRADLRDRSSLFARRESNQQTRFHWAMEFFPHSREVLQILKKHWHLLYEGPGCESFPEIGYQKHSL